ncbi:hypothetical protein DYB38_005063 [Aphanomyces astaci]|uniref:No apical meristem-associated C-terminal domain-containing protein n=1 Tax=Aphanomyces astaci TaxID=112090 RepID=A0A397D0K4_APHAT|nr:hypothetical protein DYB38_005063 [Aphanomyces astaci]
MSLWMNDMETELLSKTWVAASEDPINGSGQTSTTFWDTVTHRFNEIKPEGRPQRTARALESKFADIKHAVSKFTGCYTQVQDLQASGTNIDDVEDAARALYFKTTTSKTGSGRNFKYMGCWRVLRDKPKWEAYRENGFGIKKSTKHSKLTGEDNNLDGSKLLSSTVNLESSEGRPQGAKAAKRKRLSTEDMPQASVDMGGLAAAIDRKANAQSIVANLQLFTTPTENLTPMALRFLELQQAEVIAELELRAASRMQKSADSQSN